LSHFLFVLDSILTDRLLYFLNNNNNNDRLTAFDQGNKKYKKNK